MKKALTIITRILTLIGITLHLIYFALAILSLGDYEYSGYGVGKAFAYWIYAMIVALPVIGLYLAEGILSFVECGKYLSGIKLIAVSILVPLYLFVGASAGMVQSVVWNTYFFMIFVIQIVSMFTKRIAK